MMASGTVTLSQLESHLWEAANILRGPVDAADFKSYVFPLLLFKRLSDVHDEEHAAALKDHEQDTRGDVRTLSGKLYGQEQNLTTSAIARMNLFLHGIEGGLVNAVSLN